MPRLRLTQAAILIMGNYVLFSQFEKIISNYFYVIYTKNKRVSLFFSHYGNLAEMLKTLSQQNPFLRKDLIKSNLRQIIERSNYLAQTLPGP